MRCSICSRTLSRSRLASIDLGEKVIDDVVGTLEDAVGEGREAGRILLRNWEQLARGPCGDPLEAREEHGGGGRDLVLVHGMRARGRGGLVGEITTLSEDVLHEGLEAGLGLCEGFLGRTTKATLLLHLGSQVVHGVEDDASDSVAVAGWRLCRRWRGGGWHCSARASGGVATAAAFPAVPRRLQGPGTLPALAEVELLCCMLGAFPPFVISYSVHPLYLH
ncbi:hypothetical protein E2562_001755 [Oryza meyeriana var. granulata]|uniref:Uncharacterized protein n=1 Tax=Oryza meyeriana var. granulata TaxID=110450 RepID=A0A6G1CEQ1_9ORYZ|nr:hypothetical protein E2562_001755 [Oryza meyeriana var. granulata]